MRQKISVIIKLLTILLGAFGIGYCLITGGNPSFMFMYTTLSNLICVIYFAFLLILQIMHKLHKSNTYYLIKCTFTICILVTFLVFNIMLRPEMMAHDPNFQLFNVRDVTLHFLVPLLVFADYIVGDEKGHFKWYFSFAGTVPALLYLLLISIYNLLGGSFYSQGQPSAYPYFFLNIEKLGFGTVFLICCGIFVCVVGLTYIIVGIDSLAGKSRKQLN